MDRPDFLVIGAGFAGSVCAERLASAGFSVLVIEKRSHIGGNCYDRVNAAGVRQQVVAAVAVKVGHVGLHAMARARHLAINFHDGPLPRRGGLNAPAWALMEGSRHHGVTWHEITPHLDAGRVQIANLERRDSRSRAGLKREFRVLSDVVHPNLVAMTADPQPNSAPTSGAATAV